MTVELQRTGRREGQPELCLGEGEQGRGKSTGTPESRYRSASPGSSLLWAPFCLQTAAHRAGHVVILFSPEHVLATRGPGSYFSWEDATSNLPEPSLDWLLRTALSHLAAHLLVKQPDRHKGEGVGAQIPCNWRAVCCC